MTTLAFQTKSITPPHRTFHADRAQLIRLLTRLGRYEEAMVYWEAMERSASAGGADFSLPPVLEYNKLFDILGRAKQWPRLRAAYDRMRADGVKPNKASYQVLAHSAAVAAPWSEVRAPVGLVGGWIDSRDIN